MKDMLPAGRQVLMAQPFSLWIGSELDQLSNGFAQLSLVISESLEQNYGYVHGGVISYLADNSLTFAGATILGHCVTSEFKINYLKPARGEKLIATAQVISAGVRQTVCDCRIHVVQGTEKLLVAAAQGTIVKIQHDTGN